MKSFFIEETTLSKKIPPDETPKEIGKAKFILKTHLAGGIIQRVPIALGILFGLLLAATQWLTWQSSAHLRLSMAKMQDTLNRHDADLERAALLKNLASENKKEAPSFRQRQISPPLKKSLARPPYLEDYLQGRFSSAADKLLQTDSQSPFSENFQNNIREAQAIHKIEALEQEAEETLKRQQCDKALALSLEALLIEKKLTQSPHPSPHLEKILSRSYLCLNEKGKRIFLEAYVLLQWDPRAGCQKLLEAKSLLTTPYDLGKLEKYLQTCLADPPTP